MCQILYRAFVVRHPRLLSVHEDAILAIIEKYADWSLRDDQQRTLLHTMVAADTYRFSRMVLNRRRYRWVDGHLVIQQDEPLRVEKKIDRNRARRFTTALLKHGAKLKLDFTQADASGMIPALRVGHLWRESKVHLTQLYPLFSSGKIPFACAADADDGATPLHTMFDQTPNTSHWRVAGRVTKLAEQLCHNKPLLRSELDLLAGDKRGATPIGLLSINDSQMTNAHLIHGGYAGVAVSLMRAWQEERGPTTKSATHIQSSQLGAQSEEPMIIAHGESSSSRLVCVTSRVIAGVSCVIG